MNAGRRCTKYSECLRKIGGVDGKMRRESGDVASVMMHNVGLRIRVLHIDSKVWIDSRRTFNVTSNSWLNGIIIAIPSQHKQQNLIKSSFP